MSLITLFSRSVLALVVSLSLSFACFADTMKDSLFKDVKASIHEANKVNANLLAPISYGKAKKLFDKAELRYSKGQAIDKIKNELREATKLFNKAKDSSAIAQLTFESLMKARSDGENAKAADQAPKEWALAESKFIEAARALEQGSLKRAKTRGANAEGLYRKAELIAIKASYLDETKALIKQAKKLRVSKYAPKTLDSAQTLLKSAEKELNENRYDIDYPRSLAKQARYEAKHAIYLATQVKMLDYDDITGEELLLKAEQPLINIASDLDIAAEFDTGYDDAAKKIQTKIEGLLKDSYELGERKTEITTLEAEIAKLETRLGIQSERLAMQEAQRQKLKDITNLFSRNEATVLTQGRNVLLRLIGLTFNPGSSTIATRNFQLLNRVQQAITSYPDFRVVIEGHTDSFGSDETNLNLSMDRAKAVKEYLLANISGRGAGDIEALGYGETRPIANNETPDGRSKNRRIDLVLVPNN